MYDMNSYIHSVHYIDTHFIKFTVVGAQQCDHAISWQQFQ
jgi:hypothetical protein